MTDLFAFKSTKPEVLALEAKWQAEHDAYAKAIRSFKRKWPLKDEKGKVLPVMESRGFSRRVAGYAYTIRDIPEGWRVEKHTTITPRKGHTLGKQIATDMAKCSLRDVRNDLRALGMPPWLMNGMGITHPGVAFYDGVCWVTWAHEVKPKGKYDGYDPKIWKPGKLSEFYAAKERADG